MPEDTLPNPRCTCKEEVAFKLYKELRDHVKGKDFKPCKSPEEQQSSTKDLQQYHLEIFVACLSAVNGKEIKLPDYRF